MSHSAKSSIVSQYLYCIIKITNDSNDNTNHKNSNKTHNSGLIIGANARQALGLGLILAQSANVHIFFSWCDTAPVSCLSSASPVHSVVMSNWQSCWGNYPAIHRLVIGKSKVPSLAGAEGKFSSPELALLCWLLSGIHLNHMLPQ